MFSQPEKGRTGKVRGLDELFSSPGTPGNDVRSVIAVVAQPTQPKVR